MKIRFTNADCTEAVVTRGWWRKRSARVRRITQDEYVHQRERCWWRFVPSDNHAESIWTSLENLREICMSKHEKETDWADVDVPRARLLLKGSK